MPNIRAFACVALIGVFTSLQLSAAESEHKKKLIEFGWDEPSPTFMRQHAKELDATPFDGCVFHVDALDAKGTAIPFTWQGWSHRAFTEAELQKSLDDLKETKLDHFTDNFVRFNTAPGDLDWFDDYSAVVNNAKLAAWFAREGHCAGVLFDIEQYNTPLFNYAKQRDAKSKSWEVYAAQARKRGREVMEGFQAGCPDVTLLLTWGYSLPWQQARRDSAKLKDAPYGLLAPFLDGMLEAAKGKTRIIDGFESSYGYIDTTRFDTAYELMTTGVLPIVADAGKYKQHFRRAFGVWVDYDSHRRPWDDRDVAKNFYSPDALEKTVTAALNRSDEYVWIYTEQPKWWSDQHMRVKLNADYERALRDAQSAANSPAPQDAASNAAIVRQNLSAIEGALDQFEVDCGRYPTDEEGLAALVKKPANADGWHQSLKELPHDPWGKPYVYQCPGTHNTSGFDIYSTVGGRDPKGTRFNNWSAQN